MLQECNIFYYSIPKKALTFTLHVSNIEVHIILKRSPELPKLSALKDENV